jgi:predicted nucleic acid-binding protein
VNALFVDTSAFVALANEADRNHTAAKKLLRSAGKKRRALVTSTYVVDETLTVVRMHLGHPAAVKVGEALMLSAWCRVVDVGGETREAAWQIFVRYADQTFSFTDCTSFALMRAMGLGEAFTFDLRDFRAAGFGVVGGG